jgi:hypothetical protein
MCAPKPGGKRDLRDRDCAVEAVYDQDRIIVAGPTVDIENLYDEATALVAGRALGSSC